MAKEVHSRVQAFITLILAAFQKLNMKLYNVLVHAFARILTLLQKVREWIRASRDHYTVLIVPQKKSTVKKISASSSLIRWSTASIAVVAVACGYGFYQFISGERDASELEALRRLSSVQKEQINVLASKIGDFERKMENLRTYDQKIRAMANMTQKPGADQYRGVGGPSTEPGLSRSVSSGETAAIHQMNKSMDQLIQEAANRERSFKDILEFLEKKKSILARTPSIWPVQGWITSWFGYRPDPFTGRKEFHSAIDIAARSGREIVAPADGIVTDVSLRRDVGNTVTIDHGNGISTSYGHLLKSSVQRGKSIKRGEVIGFVGNTGRSTGSHLHYGVHLNGVPVNPRNYLP